MIDICIFERKDAVEWLCHGEGGLDSMGWEYIGVLYIDSFW